MRFGQHIFALEKRNKTVTDMKNIKIQKVLRVSMVIITVVVMFYLGIHSDFSTKQLFWGSTIFGVVGLALFAVSWVKSENRYWAKERKKSRLEAEAQPIVAPELEKISGNWYKKELVKRRLVREYVESHWVDSQDEKPDNLSAWGEAFVLCSVIVILPILAAIAITLLLLVLLFIPIIPICPATFKAARHPAH